MSPMFIWLKSGPVVDINQIASVSALRSGRSHAEYDIVLAVSGQLLVAMDEDTGRLQTEHTLLVKLLTRRATIEEWEHAMGYGQCQE